MTKPLLLMTIALFGCFTQIYTINDQQKCTNTDRSEIESHFSSKTPYRIVANNDEAPPSFPGCHPIRIWSIIRHGARNPGNKIINFAKNTLTDIKKSLLQQPTTGLCDEELKRLRSWEFNVNATEEKYLVAEGEEELIKLAERMQKRFPDVLPDSYDPSLFFFKYTATQRTLKSAESFVTGLFGRHNIGQIHYPKALHKDPVLRFYKLCNRWKQDVDKNPQTYENALKFLHGPEMKQALNFIEQKTQIRSITAKQAQYIYTICAFETAWHRNREASIWCNLFNRNTIKALEFVEDLEYYWNDGYGYNITQKIACPAIVDMFDCIDPQSNKPNATFYFTHSGTLLKMLVHLGLYRDSEPLTYRDYGKERLWRTSKIDAFATNLAFILYNCATEPMVLTMHQERVVHIPNCPKDQELCSLHTLRKIFKTSLYDCNFAETCYYNNYINKEEL